MVLHPSTRRRMVRPRPDSMTTANRGGGAKWRRRSAETATAMRTMFVSRYEPRRQRTGAPKLWERGTGKTVLLQLIVGSHTIKAATASHPIDRLIITMTTKDKDWCSVTDELLITARTTRKWATFARESIWVLVEMLLLSIILR
jgi:hypothetical protein